MSNQLTNGTFRARAGKHELCLSSKGNDQIAVKFEITEEGYEGQSITRFFSFTDAAQKYSLEALRLCGWTGDDLSADPLPGLGDTEVLLVLEYETYEGKEHLRVKYVNALDGGLNVKGMDPAAKKKFAARMKGAAIASRQAVNGTAKPAPKSREPGEDDDIAF